MRFTRFSSFAATAALGAATVLGGAGIAQANPLGSLTAGSSAQEDTTVETTPDLAVTITEADEKGGKGTFTNNTDVPGCYIALANEEAAGELKADVEAGTSAKELLKKYKSNENLVFDTLTVEKGATENWVLTFDKAFEDDFAATAIGFCQAGSERFVTIVTESVDEEAPGSLDGVLGSLGSSNADENDKVEGTDDKVGSLDGVLGSLGSSNDDGGTEDDSTTA